MGLFFSNIYLGSLSIFCVPDAVQPLQLVYEPRVIPVVFILDGTAHCAWQHPPDSLVTGSSYSI